MKMQIAPAMERILELAAAPEALNKEKIVKTVMAEFAFKYGSIWAYMQRLIRREYIEDYRRHRHAFVKPGWRGKLYLAGERDDGIEPIVKPRVYERPADDYRQVRRNIEKVQEAGGDAMAKKGPQLPGGIVGQAVIESLSQRSRGITIIRDEVETDPIKWIEKWKPHIESKEEGLVPYKPWPTQRELIRKVCLGESFVSDKARQVGWTTAVGVAFAHLFCFGKPFHGHIIANKEAVAVKRNLAITRRALRTAKIPAGMLANMYLGTVNSTEITHKTGRSENYLMAHAASPDAGHSFDGTHVLIDEMSRMPYAGEILTGMQAMLDEGAACLIVLSTYNGDGDAFCDVVDNAEGMGLAHIPADWRVHPKRNDAWRDKKLAQMKAAGNEDGFYEQYELVRTTIGEQAIDWQAAERYAKKHEYMGPDPIKGHRYSIGIDQSMGQVDRTVAVIVDVSQRPAQVIAVHVFRPNASAQATRTEQKIAFIERIWRDYSPAYNPEQKSGGNVVRLDSTNDPSVAAQCLEIPAKYRKCIRFTHGSSINKKYEPGDRLEWYMVPRGELLSRLDTNIGQGRLIVHVLKFPDLFTALKTARKSDANKRLGKHVDHIDALGMANLALTKAPPSGDNDNKPSVGIVKSSSIVSNLLEERW